MEEINGTLNDTIEIFQTELTTIQYFSGGFSIFSMLPNILVAYTLLKSKLSQLPEYLIILNWSVLNIIFILNFIYLFFTKNLLNSLFTLSYNLSTIILISTSLLVIMFNIEYILDSGKLCKNLIILVWLLGILLSCVLVFDTLLVVFEGIITDFLTYLDYAQSITLCLLIFIFVLNLFIISMQRTCYKNCKSRVMLTVIFLISYLLRWFIGNIDLLSDFHGFVITIISIALFYINGFLNFIILICFNADVKDYFWLKDYKEEVAKGIDDI